MKEILLVSCANCKKNNKKKLEKYKELLEEYKENKKIIINELDDNKNTNFINSLDSISIKHKLFKINNTINILNFLIENNNIINELDNEF